MCSTHLVMTSAKFPEVCQEMSKACFLEETPDFSRVGRRDILLCLGVLGAKMVCSGCDIIFSWSFFLLCRVVRLGNRLTRLSQTPPAFFPACASLSWPFFVLEAL